jgi:hypothetical protein
MAKSRKMRWTGHVARMGEKKNAYRLLVDKPEGKRPLGRPRRRWVDNIKIDLVEIARDDVDWMGLAQDRDKWRALVNWWPLSSMELVACLRLIVEVLTKSNGYSVPRECVQSHSAVLTDCLHQCCPTFLCTWAQFTDAYGGAGATTLLLLLIQFNSIQLNSLFFMC